MRISKKLVQFSLSFAIISTATHSMAATSRCISLLQGSKLQNILTIIDTTSQKLKALGQLTSPTTWRSETATFGIPGLDLPKELGGRNLTAVQMAAIFEYAGQYALDLRDVVGAGHARLLLQSNTPQILDVVRKVAKGEGYVAVAITEEGAGSDIHAMKSTAQKVDGGFVLSGSKLFNARLLNATHVIIFTQSPGNEGRLNTFVVPINHPGLNIVQMEAHGLLGNSFGGLKFENMFVPASMAIGDDTGGGSVFRRHFLYWRLMMAAAAIGTGQGALDQVVERMRTREVFGGAIGRFTHLQQPLAEHTAKLQMAHLLVQDAAQKIDAGQMEEAMPLVAMAKAEGVEFALAAADFAMRTFGAEGYSTKVDLGQRVIDLMGLRIADGTTDVLRSEVVRRVYGNDFWKMAFGGGADLTASSPSPAKLPPAANAPLVGGPFSFGTSIPVPVPQWPDREIIISKLQQKSTEASPALAMQEQFDPLIREGGGGACATATAFNLLQIIRSYEFPMDLLSPHAVIADAFFQMPELLDGRVTDNQFMTLLNYFKKYLTTVNFRISMRSAPQTVDNLNDPKPHEQQVYIFRVFAADGNFVGRHFVIIKKKVGNLVTVQDPHNPYKDYKYELIPVNAHPNQGVIGLVRPGTLAASSGRIFYLETVADIEM